MLILSHVIQMLDSIKFLIKVDCDGISFNFTIRQKLYVSDFGICSLKFNRTQIEILLVKNSSSRLFKLKQDVLLVMLSKQLFPTT